MSNVYMSNVLFFVIFGLMFIAFLIGGIYLIGGAIPISRNSAQVYKYGIRVKGRIEDVSYKQKARGVTVLHIIYNYPYEGSMRAGAQEIDGKTPLRRVQINQDIDVLYLPNSPSISRLAEFKYEIGWKYGIGVYLLIIALFLLALILFALHVFYGITVLSIPLS